MWPTINAADQGYPPARDDHMHAPHGLGFASLPPLELPSSMRTEPELEPELFVPDAVGLFVPDAVELFVPDADEPASIGIWHQGDAYAANAPPVVAQLEHSVGVLAGGTHSIASQAPPAFAATYFPGGAPVMAPTIETHGLPALAHGSAWTPPGGALPTDHFADRTISAASEQQTLGLPRQSTGNVQIRSYGHIDARVGAPMVTHAPGGLVPTISADASPIQSRFTADAFPDSRATPGMTVNALDEHRARCGLPPL